MGRRKYTTYACVCGHAAYWIPRRGWNCMCSNPRPVSGTVEKSQVDMTVRKVPVPKP